MFYESGKIAFLPMAFCFPGYHPKHRGDLPPPKRCAQIWRSRFLSQLPNIQSTVLCGGYALKWHLSEEKGKTLTEIVRNWRLYAPAVYPIPHPSGRNNGWLAKNPWFEQELVPQLRARVDSLL